MDEPTKKHTRLARPIGRDEMNLAEFPIALLTDRVPKGVKTLTFRDGDGTLTVTGGDAYGLPTAADSDVLISLIQFTKVANNFKNPTVPFTRYALLRLLGWPNHSHYYQRLGESLKRWHGVSLNYEQSWWDNNGKTKIDASFHILESVFIVDSPPRRHGGESPQIELPLSTFTWNHVFFKSCGDGNLKRLDLETYFSLKSAVSKQMYRFLDKRFYHRLDWTFDLQEFALEHVGLGRNYSDNGVIKKKLRPAIEELEKIGFLEERDYETRFSRIRRGLWTVRLSRKASPASQPIPSEPDTNETNELVVDLVNRGVARPAARELVEDYPQERIRLQIEVLDWRISQKSNKISDPPAWLVGAIQKGFDAPKNFVSKAEEKKRAEAKQEALRREHEESRERRTAFAAERMVHAEVLKYWNSLSQEQQTELDAQALDEAEETQALNYRQMKAARNPIAPSFLRLIRDDHIKRLLGFKANEQDGSKPPLPTTH